MEGKHTWLFMVKVLKVKNNVTKSDKKKGSREQLNPPEADVITETTEVRRQWKLVWASPSVSDC